MKLKTLGPLLGALLTCTAPLHAQFTQAPDVPQAAISSPALKPPPGVKVAIVEFDDMQCPLCGAWNPILMQAAAQYHVAWVRHDFLIPNHPLSPQEAVNARWFDSKSPKLGADYRNTVFAQQRNLDTSADLLQCTEQFARDHHIDLTFVIDPHGELINAVRADCRLATSLGVHETPTVYIVTSGSHAGGYPFVHLQDVRLLSTYLDQAFAATTDKNPVRRRN